MRAANKNKKVEVDERGRRKNAATRARRLMEKNADAMPIVAPAGGPRTIREVHAELEPPAPVGGIVAVFRNKYLLKLIVQRQLAAMYAASVLGLLWSYVQPAMRFAIYYAVMGFILRLHEGTPYFAVHLFTGMVVIHYFGETWSGGTRSIWTNRALVLKMRLPREIFPVASMLVAAYHTIPQVLVLVVFCVVSGWHITFVGVLAALLGMAIIVSFAMAMGLFFSAINVFFRDFQNIVQTVMQFMHFLVPMMYPFAMIWKAHESHPWLYNIYMANPVAQAVLLFQRFFWYDLIEDQDKYPHEFPPDLWTRGIITLVVCVALLYAAQRYFRRVEGRFPERL